MSDDLVKRLRKKRERFHDLSGVYWSEDMLCQEAADRIEADAARIAELEAERDEALRRRDAWKARAENHVEIVNALRAKTAGQDSRTLSRALLGAAFTEAETARIAAEAKLARIIGPASEVLRISDRDHPAWHALRAALEGEK